MPRPTEMPIGLSLSRTAKAVERAFDDALTAAGGSRPTWLVLLALKTGRPRTQAELAETVGIRDATLTHHLAALEDQGLVARSRDPQNRRVQQVAITDAGDATFRTLATAARTHDRRLRRHLDEAQLAALRSGLAQLRDNVAT